MLQCSLDLVFGETIIMWKISKTSWYYCRPVWRQSANALRHQAAGCSTKLWTRSMQFYCMQCFPLFPIHSHFIYLGDVISIVIIVNYPIAPVRLFIYNKKNGERIWLWMQSSGDLTCIASVLCNFIGCRLIHYYACTPANLQLLRSLAFLRWLRPASLSPSMGPRRRRRSRSSTSTSS